jgi:hypothetical protein
VLDRIRIIRRWRIDMQNVKTSVFGALLLIMTLVPIANGQQFSAWGAPVHLDWGVNTDRAEVNPVLSRDGLTLHWLCMPGTTPSTAECLGGAGYFVAHRDSADAPWGPAIPMGTLLGDGAFITIDEHRAYFGLPGENGKSDLYVSRRRNKDDDFGWGPPESLGATINTSAAEQFPSLYEDEASGATFLYFTSDRGGNDDIYASALQEDGTFSDPVPVVELNSPRGDRQVKVRRDGLECVFMSNRQGSMPNQQNQPSMDLWIATRSSTSEPWSTPVNAGAPINSGRHEGFPSYSFDGTQLYFHAAMREGNFDSGDAAGVGCVFSSTCYFDIWFVSRTKLKGEPQN